MMPVPRTAYRSPKKPQAPAASGAPSPVPRLRPRPPPPPQPQPPPLPLPYPRSAAHPDPDSGTPKKQPLPACSCSAPAHRPRPAPDPLILLATHHLRQTPGRAALRAITKPTPIPDSFSPPLRQHQAHPRFRHAQETIVTRLLRTCAPTPTPTSYDSLLLAA